MNRVHLLCLIVLLLTNATAQAPPQLQLQLHYADNLTLLFPHERIQVEIGGGVDTLFHATATTFTNTWNQKTRQMQIKGYWVVGLALTGGNNIVDEKFLEVFVSGMQAGEMTTSVAKIPLNTQTSIPQACDRATNAVLERIGAKRTTRSKAA